MSVILKLLPTLEVAVASAWNDSCTNQGAAAPGDGEVDFIVNPEAEEPGALEPCAAQYLYIVVD